ncbi:MAG: hypothetical protein F4018_02135 [Acidobacteria bacterium]|nr:hypothetical protein [Acidobacteriota bacterium]MYH28860.1 hypothetical protein [Acidobacteriota bacterium]MYK87232.1 hypothetical protein [Acidobacteriota bacterium]
MFILNIGNIFVYVRVYLATIGCSPAPVGVQAVLAIERLMESITVVAEEPQTFATNVEAEPMVDRWTWMARVVSGLETRGGRNSR